ncbi:ABC transporter permease [Cobetia marina]
MPLKQSLNRAIRRSRLKALLLVAPLLIFIGLAFVMPIFDMLSRSVDNPEVSTYLPRTSEALVDWDGEGLPDEATYAALADDLAAGLKARNLGRVASRLNYEMSGMRSLFMKSARKAARMEAPYKAALIEADEDWQDPDIWRLIKRESTPYTASYYLAAVDRQFSPTGEIVEKPEYLQIHVSLFIRTFWMSAAITGLCLLLAYPVAWLLATLPAGRGNLLMILVLLPFWTSLLVRTTTWIAILQQQGVLNDMLVGVGILAEEARIQMIYNKTGTIIAMTHILLPFMILPLYSVMKTIPPSYMHAARSLGAGPITAFRRVYFPQTLPGIRSRLDSGLHPLHRLLHHAGTGGRAVGPLHHQLHRLSHADLAQLGTGSGHWLDPAGRGDPLLSRLQPPDRCRQGQTGVTDGHTFLCNTW